MTDANQYPDPTSHGESEPCTDSLPEELRDPIDLEGQSEARNRLIARGLGAMLETLGPEPPSE